MSILLTKTTKARMFLDTPYRDGVHNIKNAFKKSENVKNTQENSKWTAKLQNNVAAWGPRFVKFLAGTSLCIPGLNVAIDLAIRHFQKNPIQLSNHNSKQRWYILTGGPGSGKTTLCTYLEHRYMVIAEAATSLIGLKLAQKEAEPWNQKEFNANVVHLMQRRAKIAKASGEPVVLFDRGPLDVLAYEIIKTSPDEELMAKIRTFHRSRYRPTVFFIENLDSCTQTKERVEDLKESKIIAERLKKTYTSLGCKLIQIPSGPVEERAKRIIDVIEKERKSR